MKEKGINTTTKEGKSSYQLKPENLRAFDVHIKDLTASALAHKKIPEIFFCSLIHQYDAYLGKLLRVAFYVTPDALNASEKQLTFSELLTFSGIDAAREYLIEKEIETVIRGSHDDQFSWIEKRFGLVLRKDLPSWPKFIEMTERRHLFVHCDGAVSSQYLAVCKKHKAAIDNAVCVGKQIGITKPYFDQAYECILEIGVKLGHVLWRKLQPDSLEKADMALHNTTFDLLLDERYSLAKTLLQFVTMTLKKHSSEEVKRMNLINLAIAHYCLGEKEDTISLLDGNDWSACTDKFKLAVAVLHDDYTKATNIMQRIGKKGEVTREAYSSWPLFRDFRKSKEFLSTYRKLFGKEFVVPQTETDQRLDINKTSQQSNQGDGE